MLLKSCYFFLLLTNYFSQCVLFDKLSDIKRVTKFILIFLLLNLVKSSLVYLKTIVSYAEESLIVY